MNYKDQLYHSGVLVHADDTLMHYGVKGMEWGEHKARGKKPTLKRSGTATKKTIGKSQAGKATQATQSRSSSGQQSSSQGSGRGKNVLGSTSSLGKKGSGTGSSSAQGHSISSSSANISQNGIYGLGNEGKKPGDITWEQGVRNIASAILDGKAKDGSVLEMNKDGERAVLRISKDGKYSVDIYTKKGLNKNSSASATKQLNNWLTAERTRRAGATKTGKGAKKTTGKGSQKAVIK